MEKFLKVKWNMLFILIVLYVELLIFIFNQNSVKEGGWIIALIVVGIQVYFIIQIIIDERKNQQLKKEKK